MRWNMAALQYVFYVSRCLASPRQVEEVLERSRSLNARSQLTGALLFTGGYFAQLLEGPAQSIHSTMERIEADSRHTAIRRLHEGPMVERRFGLWTMASTDVEGADDLLAHLLVVPEVGVERVLRLIDVMFENARPVV